MLLQRCLTQKKLIDAREQAAGFSGKKFQHQTPGIYNQSQKRNKRSQYNPAPLSPENPADTNSSIIVNESLVKQYGIKDPVGKRFGIYTQRIIRVMKDFITISAQAIKAAMANPAKSLRTE